MRLVEWSWGSPMISTTKGGLGEAMVMKKTEKFENVKLKKAHYLVRRPGLGKTWPLKKRKSQKRGE